ncbi:MAG: hypothetical protein R3185_07800 [Candidatus Thermoplasmatota archaeon]|nr:hypothetical protein [Candidatus Thermoplasmatota archaeon]
MPHEEGRGSQRRCHHEERGRKREEEKGVRRKEGKGVRRKEEKEEGGEGGRRRRAENGEERKKRPCSPSQGKGHPRGTPLCLAPGSLEEAHRKAEWVSTPPN